MHEQFPVWNNVSALISQVKMKERTKGPHDTVHISLAASGTGLATPSLTPLKSHGLHQEASASGDSQ